MGRGCVERRVVVQVDGGRGCVRERESEGAIASYLYLSIYMYVYVYMCISIWVCVCIYIYIYIYICICIYMCVCIYTIIYIQFVPVLAERAALGQGIGRLGAVAEQRQQPNLRVKGYGLKVPCALK